VKGTVFKTNFKPDWWYLGIEMTILWVPQNNGTYLASETKSQWFILGEIGDIYNRYLRDFMQDVRLELQRIAFDKKNASV
jgi:hypothetical protein